MGSASCLAATGCVIGRLLVPLGLGPFRHWIRRAILRKGILGRSVMLCMTMLCMTMLSIFIGVIFVFHVPDLSCLLPSFL